MVKGCFAKTPWYGYRPGKATPPVRLAQSYAGPGYGLHMPLHKGADLVLAFEDGDIDRPIALGAVPNPSQASPVTVGNKTESVLKTASGHIFKLDDLEGKTRILMQSAKGQLLLLDDTPDTAGILLATPHKHRLRLDDKGDTLELTTGEGSHGLTILNKDGVLTLKTKSGHVLHLDDKAKSATFQSGKGNLLKLDDNANTVTLQDSSGKHLIQIDGGGKIVINTQGDLELQAKGKLKMKGAEVSIESASGAVSIKSAQALNLQGMNANVKADQKLALQSGMDTGIKAGMNLKLEGTMNVESKAGVANKMTGTMTNVEASAMNTLKGAVVMIN